MLIAILIVCSALGAPKSLPAMRVVAADGATLERESMTIAIAGNTRDKAVAIDKARATRDTGHAAVLGDMTAVSMTSGIDALFLLGDMVANSSPAHWERFGTRHASVIDGTVAPPSAVRRVPVLPVVGDRDCAKEPSCASVAKVFPGFGVEIGFGRVATWHHLDLRIGSKDSWRVVVVDSNKKGLGSRWHEQLSWLKTVVSSPGSGLVVLMHEGPVDLGRVRKNAGPRELMDVINEHAPLLSLRAVFSAGRINNQAFLPEGALGPLHVVAGGGGAPGEDLERGTLDATQGLRLVNALEKGVDGTIDGHLFNPVPPDQKSIDEALGTGSFKGYPRRVDAGVFPLHGWWKLHLQEGTIEATLRTQRGDGTIADSASLRWTAETGWLEGA